jgi:D-3-phosphoglycerate dehydrogenase
MIMKIIVCDPTEAEAIQQMRAAGLEVDVRDSIPAEELIQVIGDYDTIDVEHARAKGVAVMNTPAASSAAVAELTLGYMFALARHVYETTASMKAGKWEKKKFKGDELGGKILGIAGIGNIGKEVAKRALALGMQVIAYDPYVPAPQGVEQVQDMDAILKRSDYLTFHLPLTSETRNMIGPDEFAKMKTGVRIINCARGGIIDENALYDALLNGKVAGAALDVYTVEPYQGHKLFTLDQVIGSPHIGAATEEAQGRIGAEVAQILIEFAKKDR